MATKNESIPSILLTIVGIPLAITLGVVMLSKPTRRSSLAPRR